MAAAARQAYRRLLKAVDQRIASPRTDLRWRNHVSTEFRKPLKQGTSPQQRLQLASDYAFLIHSVHEQKELLASYNIGIDRQARQREDIRKSAARAGLSLPAYWDEPGAKAQTTGTEGPSKGA